MKSVSYYDSLTYPIEIVRLADGVFAFHPDLDGCAAQGSTVDEAISNLDAARKLWLQVRIEDRLPIEEPVNEDDCSGRVSLRMAPDLHAALIRISRRRHVSLNQLLNTILAEYVGGNRLQQQFLEALRELKATFSTASSASTSQPIVQQQRVYITTGPRQGYGGAAILQGQQWRNLPNFWRAEGDEIQ